MAETKLLTNHDDIRAWAAARLGSPAFGNAASSIDGGDPTLLLLFDQIAYEDQDHGADRATADGPELAEWDDWFAIFDKQQLGLVVAVDEPGHLDQFHELVRR